jgi:uncharacterized membrane protein YbhN (UPF0104 family)
VTQARRGWARRALRWTLAVAAVGFVAWMVPVRDRCWDERAAQSTRAAVTRDAQGCTLHLRRGDVRIDAAQCAQLKCEPGIVTTMASARLGWLAGLLGLYALGTLAWAARWRALLGFAGIDLPVMHLWRVSIEAQAGGILLPGGLGGDALRVAAVAARPTREGEARAPLAIVVASVVLDRAVGLSLIAGVAAALGYAWGGLQAGPLAAVLAAIPVAVLGGLVFLRRAPIERLPWLGQGRVGRALTPVLAYMRDPRAPRAVALAALLSLAVAATQFAVIRGLVAALGAAPSQEKWVYVGAAMAFIVGALPLLPGSWGTADAAYVFFFGLGGLSRGVALAVCLLFRLFWYLSGVVGAVLQVAHPRSKSTP